MVVMPLRSGAFAAAFVAVTVAPGAARGEGSFRPGHLYVSVRESEACRTPGYREAILEVNPADGSWRVFADNLDDGLCVITGLRFTPDGRKLLALNSGHILPPVDYGWIQAFSPDGSSEVILDQTDGLVRPAGTNGLAFGADGDLYVANGNSTILRFPAGGGTATTFADAADGIAGAGAVDFASGGDLFYAGHLADVVIGITPIGEATVFDRPPFEPWALASDRSGNLFVSTFARDILRYEGGDPASRRPLTTFGSGPPALTVSLDGNTVYAADWGTGLVYAVDALDGTRAVVANVGDWSNIGIQSGGIALWPPPIPGDLDSDGDLDLRDFARLTLCGDFAREPVLGFPCVQADFDKDNDVDLADSARFTSLMTGPSFPK